MEENIISSNQDLIELIELGWALKVKETEKSKATSLKTLELSGIRKYKDGIIFSLRNLGEIYYLLHDYEESLRQVEQALDLIGDSGHPAKHDLFMTAAASHTRMNNLAQALAHCQLAEKAASGADNQQQKAAAYKAIGSVNILSGNYGTSIAYYNQALEIYKAIGDIAGEIIIMNNMSHCYHQAGNYDLAAEVGLKGIDLYSKWEHNIMLPTRVHAYNLNNIGMAFLKSKDYEKSKPFFEKALAIFDIESDIYGEIYSYRGLGEICLYYQKYAQAIIQLERALELAEIYGELAELSQCHKVLAAAYKQRNEYERALLHYEKYYQFDKQLRNDETNKRLQNLEATYQLEKSKHEAEIYQLKTVALQKEIDERILAQKEALIQANYFKALLDNSPFAILAVSVDGIIEECNLAFERLFGLSKKEVLNKPIAKLFDQDEINEEFQNNVSKILAGKAIREVTKRPHRDGTLIDVELHTASIMLDGVLTGSLVHYHDIRENIQREASLEAAKLAAETAVKTKSEFLAKMSHEIRTPLNGVIGVSDLLMQSTLTPQQQEFAQIIYNSGAALLRIINDILDFSKIEAGKLALERHPFSLRQAVEDTIDLLALKAAQKSLDIGCIIYPPAPLIVIGDVTRFQQILMNLLSNSLKFTDIGHVFIIINWTILDNQLVEIQVEVQDTGMGISPKEMSRLFTAFSQADNSISRKYGGTGLGLSISKQLAELMSGKMWVTSEVGYGTSFYFIILLENVSLGKNFSQEYQSRFRGKQLLVVDNNRMCRICVEVNTAVWGIESVGAETHDEALQHVQAGHHFDVILLDYSMPDGDINHFATTLRKTLLDNCPPLLLMHNSCHAGYDKNLFDGCIAKPIKQSELESALSHLFSVQLDNNKLSSSNIKDWNGFASSHPLTILLVEDNVINQQVALNMLSQFGYQIDVVANGLDALAAVRNNKYDVIFMDISMPEMDGVTATRKIRDRYKNEDKRPYIIALTANALTGDREQFLSEGMDDYVSKPVILQELAEALKKAYQTITA